MVIEDPPPPPLCLGRCCDHTSLPCDCSWRHLARRILLKSRIPVCHSTLGGANWPGIVLAVNQNLTLQRSSPLEGVVMTSQRRDHRSWYSPGHLLSGGTNCNRSHFCIFEFSIVSRMTKKSLYLKVSQVLLGNKQLPFQNTLWCGWVITII